MEEKLDIWFTYHPPTDGDTTKYTEIRDAARVFAGIIARNTPSGPDQTVAIRKIREAVMTANASIACKGV